MADVDTDTAYAILEPYFLAAKEVGLEFAEEHQLDVRRLRRVKLVCDIDMHDSPRHFAGASQDGRLIAAAPQMVELPEDTVAAIFAHEFGHILDFQNPAVFYCDVEEERLVMLSEEEGPRGDRMRIARMRQWEQRGDHAIELTADLIAEKMIGVRIGYSGPCMLQGFDRGVSRPKSLR